MLIGNYIDVECDGGKYVMDYGSYYKSNVVCTSGDMTFIRQRTSNGCVGKYCSYSFTGNIVVKSSKTIPTSIAILNQILDEKPKSDSSFQ